MYNTDSLIIYDELTWIFSKSLFICPRESRACHELLWRKPHMYVLRTCFWTSWELKLLAIVLNLKFYITNTLFLIRFIIPAKILAWIYMYALRTYLFTSWSLDLFAIVPNLNIYITNTFFLPTNILACIYRRLLQSHTKIMQALLSICRKLVETYD